MQVGEYWKVKNCNYSLLVYYFITYSKALLLFPQEDKTQSAPLLIHFVSSFCISLIKYLNWLSFEMHLIKNHQLKFGWTLTVSFIIDEDPSEGLFRS